MAILARKECRYLWNQRDCGLAQRHTGRVSRIAYVGHLSIAIQVEPNEVPSKTPPLFQTYSSIPIQKQEITRDITSTLVQTDIVDILPEHKAGAMECAGPSSCSLVATRLDKCQGVHVRSGKYPAFGIAHQIRYRLYILASQAQSYALRGVRTIIP